MKVVANVWVVEILLPVVFMSIAVVSGSFWHVLRRCPGDLLGFEHILVEINRHWGTLYIRHDTVYEFAVIFAVPDLLCANFWLLLIPKGEDRDTWLRVSECIDRQCHGTRFQNTWWRYCNFFTLDWSEFFLLLCQFFSLTSLLLFWLS